MCHMVNSSGQVGPSSGADIVGTHARLDGARGPDGLGLWSSADNCCTLGHRRLSIIDLSTDAGAADGQRGRHRGGHIQRRDLQPHGSAA